MCEYSPWIAGKSSFILVNVGFVVRSLARREAIRSSLLCVTDVEGLRPATGPACPCGAPVVIVVDVRVAGLRRGERAEEKTGEREEEVATRLSASRRGLVAVSYEYQTR